MFKEKKEKPFIVGNQQNRITEGTVITGDIQAETALRIDGIITGNITTPAKVVLGPTGQIKGTLDCGNADIEGKFIGNIKISGVLTLKSTACIEGEVIAGQLAIEPGATFNATCVMKGGVKSINQNQPFDKEGANLQNRDLEKSDKRTVAGQSV